MYAPQQIVVPVDFSEHSRAAAQRALVIAKAFEAPLHLVHAVAYPLVATYSDFSAPPGTWEALRDDAGEQLKKLEGELANQGASISSELAERDPLTAIRSAVEKRSANLIVMGTHGWSGLSHVLLGSVAERTLRTVDCATLAVKEPESEASKPIRRIVFATDFSEDAKHAAELACGFAKQFGASVQVIHVFVLPGDLVGPYGIPPATELAEQMRDQAREMLDQASQVFADAGVTHDRQLSQGVPSRVVAAEAERLGAELIVMGTRGNTGLKHVFFGSVAERTLRAAPCSVLTTKDSDPM